MRRPTTGAHFAHGTVSQSRFRCSHLRQVDVPNRSLVLSERAAYMSKLVQRLEVSVQPLQCMHLLSCSAAAGSPVSKATRRPGAAVFSVQTSPSASWHDWYPPECSQVGDVVTARVHRLMDFGAFVYIQDDSGDLHGEVCKPFAPRSLPVLNS